MKNLHKVDPSKFYTIEETADFLDIAVRTVRKYLDEEKLVALKVKGRLMFPGESILNAYKNSYRIVVDEEDKEEVKELLEKFAAEYSNVYNFRLIKKK